MLLVKYTQLEYGLMNVKNGELKLSRPLDVNDPYEMMGTCVGRFSKEARRELCEDMTYKWTQETMAPSGRGCVRPLNEVKYDALNYGDTVFKNLIVERRVVQELERIVCFINPRELEEHSDQLMWAHYGDGGAGVRVWFDTDKFSDKHPPVFPVVYKDKRPVLDLGKCEHWMDEKAYGEFARATMLTKSKAWEYEHEYRMFAGQKTDPSLLVRHDGFDFIRIPKSAIVKIDFGPKGMRDETVQIMKELRENDETRHIQLMVAAFCEQDYGYRYVSFERFVDGQSDEEV